MKYPGAAPGPGLGEIKGFNLREPGAARASVWNSGGSWLLILLVLASLLGCSVNPPEPRVVRVEVPVLVPCQAPVVATPPWAAAGLRKTDPLELKVRALLAERRQARGYIRELEAAAGACR